MSDTIMVDLHFLIQNFGPLIVIYSHILFNILSCTPNNSVIAWDIFMKFYMNVY